jgi:hypothetical protein
MIRRAILTTAALGLFACTVTVDITYLGNEISVSGEWLVDGQDATAATCSAAGISMVEVKFNDGVGYTREEFTFPCAQGSFDTRPTLVLNRISYETEWFAYAEDGSIVNQGGVLPLDLSALAHGDHAILATADFLPAVQSSTLTVNVGWETVNMVQNQTCEVSSVDTMTWILKDETGATILDSTDTACAATVDFTEILPGTYSLEVSGTSADGTVDWSTECTGLLIEASTDHSYDCAIPWTSTDPILVVNLRWDADPSAAAATMDTCEAAGVATWSYSLAGPETDAMTTIPCANAFYWRGIAEGSYDLTADGDDADGVKRWMGACNGLTVGTEGRSIHECQLVDNSGG